MRLSGLFILSSFIFTMVLGGSCFAEEICKKAVTKVKTDKPMVALTFDDGPCGQTQALLDLFKKEGVKATFFVKGKNAAGWAEMSKKIVDAGHELGNHSYTHANLTKLDEEGVRKEIEQTQKEIKEKVGVELKVFRAPFLAFNDTVWKVLAENKLPAINCSADTRDWDKATTVEQIVERATSKTEGGTVILMHGWSKNTLQALPEIIKKLKEKGLQFVTVSELLASGKEEEKK
ncbi:MAG: polysaccharide deacetylase family protein [Planctomycetes bacterium]|nr:polysaccharide deacetylase family protein [Planctomycetota bacterium]